MIISQGQEESPVTYPLEFHVTNNQAKIWLQTDHAPPEQTSACMKESDALSLVGLSVVVPSLCTLSEGSAKQNVRCISLI